MRWKVLSLGKEGSDVKFQYSGATIKVRRGKKKKKTEVTAQNLTEKQSTKHTNSDSRMPELMGKVLSFGKAERVSFLLQTFGFFSLR